jgi:hypothetical protein
MNLSSSTFSFALAGSALTVSSSTINANGTSAALTVVAAANTNGRFAVVATNSSGVDSGVFVTAADAFGVFSDPNADADNDGLANGYELLLGTDPFNPDTDGDGFSDGIEVASGSDPLNPACTPLNCRVPGGETDSLIISALNMSASPGRFSETESVTFSLLDIANPISVVSEADSSAFSVLNAANQAAIFNEADSITFSVCNSASAMCPGFTSNLRKPALPTAVQPHERDVSISGRNSGDPGPVTTVPTVVAVAPAVRASGVAANAPVTLIFSVPMDADTLNTSNLQLLVGREQVKASITISSDFRAATLIADLPPETDVTIAATAGAESLFGEPLAEFQSQFRTAAQDRQPVSIHQFPVTGAGGVPPEASILLATEQPHDANAATGTLQVTQDGDPVQGTTRTGDGSMHFAPVAPFTAGAAVALSITQESGDTTVNALGGFSGVFVVAGFGYTLPTPLRAYPGNSVSVELHPVIEIEFDRPLDPASVTADSLSLHVASDGSLIPAAVSLHRDRIIRLTPFGALTPFTAYYYEVSARVRDVTGTPAAREILRFFQTSGDFGGATSAVREILPREESRNVGTGSPIIIKFEKSVNPVSVTVDTIRLTAEQHGLVPASISFGEDFREVILTPLEPMPANARITLTVSGIEDASGNITRPRVTQFSTGSARSSAGNEQPNVRR